MSKTLVSIKNLKTYYKTRKGMVKAVDDVSFDIKEDEVFGLVGESGCGKSTTALSLLRIIPYPGKIVGGSILFDGEDLLKLSEKKMREFRGAEISMIFQDPTSALNPVFTIGDQIIEAIKLHQKVKGTKAWDVAAEVLKDVGIPSPEKRVKNYPHQFSGGMKQRAMIALALSCKPSLLIADEATTNLDVTIQAKILKLIKSLQERLDTSILYITHNIGVIAQISDRMGVMYAGKLVELGGIKEVFKNPAHPYTKALLNAFPDPRYEMKELEPIPGRVPSLLNPPQGCRFHSRCPKCSERCEEQAPQMKEITKGHYVSCFDPLS